MSLNDHSPKDNYISPIAVVMATYNGVQFLEEQIESILAQTIPPSLFIVFDDGSTDQTYFILQKYQAAGKLTCYQNETRLGLVANFKQGIHQVPAGYYFALSDQDDIWHVDKLEKCMACMRNIENPLTPCLVYSDLNFIDANGKLINVSFRNELGHDKYRHTLDTLLFGNFVLGCTTLCNESMKLHIKNMPINANFNHDAWMALLAYALGNAYSIKESLISYRQHEQNSTISHFKKVGRWRRYLNHIKLLFSNNNYLMERFIMVQLFLENYQHELSSKHQKKLTQFLALEKKLYLLKKFAFEKAFFGKWFNRFK